ncbi:hypothetical protein DL96DRAFT_1581066 [Flagelloscypha sp. PMI_526]|nr:hypothetical protein DL96DRAFT_1581066 [Flagelloscypha sp. PMI_526]
MGPQLDAFCIETLVEHAWEQLHPTFRNTFRINMLRIRSLELLGISQTPLLKLLSHFPFLERLSLRADEFIIGAREDDVEVEELLSLPNASSILIDGFVEDDFAEWTSLSRYMLAAASEMESLILVRSTSDEFPVDWYFLEPYTSSLHHLSFSTHLYQTIVKRDAHQRRGYHSSPELDIFPQLRSITFSIPNDASPLDWEAWSNWVARTMDNPIDALPFLTNLKFILQSTLVPSSASSTTLDELATSSNFEIHIIVTCPVAGFSETVSAFRGCLPSWDAVGRLKFWMRG